MFSYWVNASRLESLKQPIKLNVGFYIPLSLAALSKQINTRYEKRGVLEERKDGLITPVLVIWVPQSTLKPAGRHLNYISQGTI